MGNKTIIYHNSNCSKSCESLDLLLKSGKEIEVVEYLTNPPTRTELLKIISLLKIKPQDLIRKNEQDYIHHFSDKDLNDEEWIQAMHDYPQLIERPIVIVGDKAIIGRPPSLVLDLIKTL